jgi:hypothetical protein
MKIKITKKAIKTFKRKIKPKKSVILYEEL